LPLDFQQKTNSSGEATILAPHDIDEPVSVSAWVEHFTPIERSGRRYEGRTNRPTGFLWDPTKPEPVTVVMRDTRGSTVTLSGRVVDQKGAPVANASVAASGQGYQHPMPFFRNVAYTNAKGEFSLSLSKNMFYVFFVETGDHLAAQKSFAIGENAPPEPVNFTVEPTSAITVRTVDAATGQAAPNSMVQVSLVTVGDYRSRYVLGKEEPKLHTSRSLSGHPSPTAYVFRGNTNEKGEFECFLPKGKFQAIHFGGSQNDECEFLVMGKPTTVEVFTNAGFMFQVLRGSPRPADIPKAALKGKVTDVNGNPIADAEVSLTGRVPMMVRDAGKATTNAAGEFELERDPRATLLRVISKDQSLVSLALIASTSSEANIVLAPTPRVIGQLVDAKTKAPLVGKKMQAVRGTGSWSTGDMTATATTDDQGRFILSPVIPGITFSIMVVEGDLTNPRTHRATTWATVFPESPGQTIDLGEMLISEGDDPAK
jgi:hypothetical protein